VKITRLGTSALLLGGLLSLPIAGVARAQEDLVQVRVERVRETPVVRALPLSGRVFSRNDAAMSLTLSGEMLWVLEPGVHVEKGEIIAQLDQKPILLRKSELQHQVSRERVNGAYLDKELTRLRRLQQDNNASERLVDESESSRDISRLELKSLESRLDQLDDELRRSQLIAPFSGVIAERSKRGGEYARSGDVILRLTISRSGTVEDAEVIRSINQRMDAEAVRAARTWRYQPARLHGEPVRVFKVISIRFALTGR